ncbi:hypothetical protein [Leadbetterella sp. DM7]|uniref:hypothetical protein n=1 Tax=Leadbetterella sp. DM7 TaxID=3235085 RepID=UPI00349EC75E
MKTDFLVDFFKEITSESLHREAIEYLHSFPLSEQSAKAIEALGDKATSPSIDLADYSRVFPKNGNGELMEMDADFFISNYYTTKVDQFTKKLLKDFEVFLSDTDLCGSDNGKVEALKNVLNSLNHAAYKVLDIRIRFPEIKEAILDTIFKLIDRVIQELSQLDVQEYPKYDIDKLKEFIREPFSDMREEETGFVHLISNRKEENYYLFNVPEEKIQDDVSSTLKSEEPDKGYEEFKTDKKKLFELELKNQRVFDDMSFRQFYERLITFNKNPVALPVEQRLRLSYSIGCKMEMLGTLLDCIFESTYFQGDREKFNNFITGCLLDRGGKEIISVSSIRRKPS